MSNANAVAMGVFNVKCYGADGELKWEEENPNLVVNTGLQYMAGAALTGGTTSQITTWYLGLVDNSPTPAYLGTNTMASHGGWNEVATNVYSGANRISPTFTAATLGSGSSVVTNATAAAFSITLAGPTSIAGAFLTDTPAKSPGNTGLLFSVSNFTGSARSVIAGDTLNVTYTFTLTAGA